jgi:hypothetical protein
VKTSPNLERIQLLERYLEDREDIQLRVYRLVESAAKLKLPPGEMETVVKLLQPLQHDSWSVQEEIRKLKGEKG